MKLSVIVPVNEDARLARCLEGLIRQTVDAASYEVIVVDDGSSEGTRALAARFPVRYLTQQNRGAYAARNLGIQEARGDVLAFTDADCLPPPQWLSVIQSVFDRRECDVAVSFSYALNRDPVGLLVQMVDDERWARLAREEAVTYCDTRNLAGRRQAFLDEPFDDQFRHGGDLEWGVRAARRPYRIKYVPEMALGHENVSSLGEAWRRGVRRGQGVATVYRKHGRGTRISGARPVSLMGIDLKQRLLETVTHPLLRPLAWAGITAGNALLLALLAGLLAFPALRPRAHRPFHLFDRTSLLQGRILGS